MRKNILFISIFDLTRLFFEIAQGLIARGHRVYWLTTNEYWTLWLVEHRVCREDITQLVYDPNDFLDEKSKESLRAEIVRTESASDLTVNEALMMDRFVMYKNKPDINDYMYLYYRDIKSCLIGKAISHVVAEPTNSNELVTDMLCQELRIPMLVPSDGRFSHERLIFHLGNRPSNLVAGPGAGIDGTGRALLEAARHAHVRPHYFAKNCRIPILTVDKVHRTVRNRLKFMKYTRRRGLTHHELSERLGKSVQRVIGQTYLRNICRYDKLESIEGKIAFFPLHLQPESSIDVFGPYVNNQLELIRNIRRALPFDVTLVVKEHPNLLGLKSPGFFRELRRIPNVTLVKHTVSNFDIYKRASIVFTVSGTPAFEAGMLGIPAVTFSPMYYGGLSSVHYCADVTRVKELAEMLLNRFRRDYDADCRFLDRLLQSCYDCHWTDPVSDPAVMNPENITRLQAAFVDVIESFTERFIQKRTEESVTSL